MLTNRSRGILCLFLIILFAGCGFSPQASRREVGFDGLVQFSIPDEFVEAGNLHDNAELQFRSPENDVYLVGIKDTKRNLRRIYPRFTIEDYLTFVTNKFTASLDTFWTLNTCKGEHGGFPALVSHCEGILSGAGAPAHVRFSVLVLENERYFFQVVSWGDEYAGNFLHTTNENLLASISDPSSTGGSQGSSPQAAGE